MGASEGILDGLDVGIGEGRSVDGLEVVGKREGGLIGLGVIGGGEGGAGGLGAAIMHCPVVARVFQIC